MQFQFKSIIFLIVLVIFIGSCIKNTSFKKDIDKSSTYWIDFQAGFSNDTITVVFNKNDTLINNRITSTPRDDSYFTGVRIIHELEKKSRKSLFSFNEKVVKSEHTDTLKFDLTINHIKSTISLATDSTKVFSISYDKKLQSPILSRYYHFFSYQ